MRHTIGRLSPERERQIRELNMVWLTASSMKKVRLELLDEIEGLRKELRQKDLKIEELSREMYNRFEK